MTLPPAPKNVRIHYRDGSSVPVEVAYKGLEPNDEHPDHPIRVWRVTSVVQTTESNPVTNLTCESLPGYSAILIGVVEVVDD